MEFDRATFGAGGERSSAAYALRYAVYSYIAPPRPASLGDWLGTEASPDPTIAMVQRRLAATRLQQQQDARYLPARPTP